MSDILPALIVFALLVGSALLGRFIRPRLPEAHRGRETLDTMQLLTGVLVTFAALVLGLLTASVKNTYDRAKLDRQDYALVLTQFDECLRDYGADADAARAILRTYTASVIASTWPDEPRPPGIVYPDVSRMPRVGASPILGRLMNQVELALHRLTPSDPFHSSLQGECLSLYQDVLHGRRTVIEDVGTRISAPFYRILVFWLIVVFANFGLGAPRNLLSLIGIALCAVSISSAIFVILDLSHPYSGLFAIGSAEMRQALTHMLQPP